MWQGCCGWQCLFQLWKFTEFWRGSKNSGWCLTYDDIGNVIGVTDPNPDPLTNLGKSGFQYDGLSRLKAVTLADGSYGYAYNASGDITQKTTPQGSCTYAYDSTTYLLGSITGTCGETASSVIYDSLKNVRGKDGTALYTYNSANQLVRQNGTFYAEYDGNGNRFRSSMQQWNLNGSGAFSSVAYLNLFSKGGKNLAEVDHRVDTAGSFVKKNYRNHVYLGAAHLAYVDDCQINKNLAIGVCGDVDDDGDGLTYLQELDKGTYPFDKDSDHDGIPDYYDLFPTDPNPKFQLESAGGYRGSDLAHI